MTAYGTTAGADRHRHRLHAAPLLGPARPHRQGRFGVELPYAEQRTWGITALRAEQLHECVRETHSDENILGAEPYPARSRRSRLGTRRATGSTSPATARRAHEATPARWLERIGLPYDDLHCSFDKVSRCVELGIDVLIDDSPVNLVRAADEAASRRDAHPPLERATCRGGGRHRRRDWPELREPADCREPGRARLTTRPWPTGGPGLRRRGPAADDRARRRARDEPAGGSPPSDGDLRDLLPAIEPDRRLTDWGRSERIEGLLDRTVADFFYHYWFRCEVEGIEHVPADGGALLVSNHAGALPPDAAMIAKAIKEEHPRPRPLHITVEHFFKGYPGFSMLLPKIGASPPTPANVHRLLYDEEQLVLVFPEGRKGTEKLYKDRYRLRRFGRGGFVEAAMRARAPIVPVCRRRRRGGRADLRPRSRRCSGSPGSSTSRSRRRSRTSACSGCSATCRRSSGSGSWRRSPTDDGHAPERTRRSCRPSPTRSAPRSRSTCSTWSAAASPSGSDEEMPIPGASSSRACLHLLGRPPAQALEADPEVEAIIGVDRRPAEGRARAHRVRAGRHSALADPPDRRGGRDRHGGRHPPGRRLDRHHAARWRTRTTSSGR